jgi:hypothetical protein
MGVKETPMRQCPTPEGAYHPLIAHRITSALCLARQRDFYHKCHRCRYRGQPAGLSLEEPEPVADDRSAAQAGRP